MNRAVTVHIPFQLFFQLFRFVCEVVHQIIVPFLLLFLHFMGAEVHLKGMPTSLLSTSLEPVRHSVPDFKQMLVRPQH